MQASSGASTRRRTYCLQAVVQPGVTETPLARPLRSPGHTRHCARPTIQPYAVAQVVVCVGRPNGRESPQGVQVAGARRGIGVALRRKSWDEVGGMRGPGMAVSRVSSLLSAHY